jgi:hypothetical protein
VTKLSYTHPELFSNPTLGEATKSPFLDQVEAQKIEDFNARDEDRAPRTVVAGNRYPQFMPSGTVSSDIQPDLSYSDGDPVNEGTNVDGNDDPFSDEDYE